MVDTYAYSNAIMSRELHNPATCNPQLVLAVLDYPF